MKVFVTKYVTSGHVKLVDLAQSKDGKYWSGEHEGLHYFLNSKEVALTADDARLQVAERFKKRRSSLMRSLYDLTSRESRVLKEVDRLLGECCIHQPTPPER